MTAVASLLPPDVQVEITPATYVERLYVYGDGALWLLDGPSMRIVADGVVHDWLNAAEDTGARQNWKTSKWSKLPKDIYATGYSPAPLGSSDNAARVVSYDEDIPALCRELAPADGTPNAHLSAADWQKLAQPRLSNLLAYIALTGSMPKGLHQGTWSLLHQLTVTPESGTRVYDLRPEGTSLAGVSPLGRVLRALITAGYRWYGWGAGRYGHRAKFLELRKERDDGSSLDCTVWWDAASGNTYWSFEMRDVHGHVPRGPDGKRVARAGEKVELPVGGGISIPEDLQ